MNGGRSALVGLLGLGVGLLSPPPDARAQSFQHDTSLPIEITADRLEVVQAEQLATFTGNVDAVQGDLVLSADLLRVHYRSDGSGDAAASAPGSSIRRIEAEGHVFVSSPQETAQGEVGVYDVDRNALTLEGSVILTRDQNVIRGQRLEIDLVTGRSRMLSALPGSEGGTPAQRVRAIFTPQKPAPSEGPVAQNGAVPRPPDGKPAPTR